MLYFDAVFSHSGVLLFNGTPEETQKFIKREPIKSDSYVIQGQSLRTFSVKEYLEL